MATRPSLTPSLHTAAMQPSLIRAIHDRKRSSSLNLGLGQPSLPVPEQILEQGLQRLRAGSMGYTANAGRLSLREKILDHFALPHVTRPDQVVVTCGAQEAIFAVLMACLDPGDEILVPDPGFPSYAAVATLLGAQCKRVPRDPSRGFRLDAQAVAGAIGPRSRVVILNSPGNPTGTVDEHKEVEALVELADRHDLILLSDEIYADLCYLDERPFSAAQLSERCIVISGMSKNCAMTGFRLGYALGPVDLMTGVLRAHHMAATCAPVLSQHMAEVAFEDPDLLVRHLPIYRERRQRALATLAREVPAPFIKPDGAFYIMLDCSAYSDDSTQLALDLLDQQDVITAPGRAFGEVAEGWLRLTFADDVEVFALAAQRIGAFLREIEEGS